MVIEGEGDFPAAMAMREDRQPDGEEEEREEPGGGKGHGLLGIGYWGAGNWG